MGGFASQATAKSPNGRVAVGRGRSPAGGAAGDRGGRGLLGLRVDSDQRRRAPLAGDGRGRRRRSHHFLAKALADARPDDAILSEEGRESPNRLAHNRVWIVDPLDGTNEYGEDGRAEWAVHVALWSVRPSAAARSPCRCSARRWPPSRRRSCHRSNRDPPRIVTSAAGAATPPRSSARRSAASSCAWASAGAKAMAVVLGQADIYVHDGGMYEWDSAAPSAVAAAAGLHVSRLDGSPLVYNQPRPVAARLPRLPSGAGRPGAGGPWG